MSQLKNLVATILKNKRKIFYIILVVLLFTAGVVGFLQYGSILAFLMIYPWMLSKLTGLTIDIHIAKAIAVIATVILVLTIRYLILFQSHFKKILGYFIWVSMFCGHSIFISYMTPERYFSAVSGEPEKYFSMNPIDGSIQLFDTQIYDAFGNKTQPMTPAVTRDIELQKLSKKTQTEVPASPVIRYSLRTH